MLLREPQPLQPTLQARKLPGETGRGAPLRLEHQTGPAWRSPGPERPEKRSGKGSFPGLNWGRAGVTCTVS